MDNTQQQYPCMQMTIEQWIFAEPYLKKWEYNITNITNSSIIDQTAPLIILNYAKFGVITNLTIDRAQASSRYLVEDLDIFLAQAAELKGYKYTKPIKNQTYTSYSELQGHKLQPGDTVVFTFENQTYKYFIEGTYLQNYNLNIYNDIIFKVLNLNISEFCTAALGYTPKFILSTPLWAPNDFVGATNLCLALFKECERQTFLNSQISRISFAAPLLIPDTPIISQDSSLLQNDSSNLIPNLTEFKLTQKIIVDNEDFSFEERKKNDKYF